MSSSPRVRMSPDSRREQLLDLGTRLLSTRPLDELSIELLAEEAGISRGLLYHYFGNKQEFHVAVVQRVVDDLYAITGPRGIEDHTLQMVASIGAYVDFVVENFAGYVSLVRAAAGGNDELQAIYLEARRALTDRIFEVATPEQLAEVGIVDSPATRLLIDGWAAFTEEVVISWIRDPHGLSKDELLLHLAKALPAIVA